MTPEAGNVSRSQWLALAAMALGVFVIANDFTALSVAIPRIETDLHTSLNRTQWVINGYALVFGVLIVTGGRLADMFGRRRIFFIGASVFAVFSASAYLPVLSWILTLSRSPFAWSAPLALSASFSAVA